MTMKLSEAIREGAKLRPQAFGAYFENGCSCAMGAAIEAKTGCTNQYKTGNLMNLFPELNLKVYSPVKTIFSHIIFLNDKSKWTREQIADWLEREGY